MSDVKLMPTPPIGERIVFFERGDKSASRAAIVTNIEECGKIKLIMFAPNGVPAHRMGVLHASHPQHEVPGNPVTFRTGSWDYVRGAVPKEDFDAHKKLLKEREESRVAQLKAFEAAQLVCNPCSMC